MIVLFLHVSFHVFEYLLMENKCLKHIVYSFKKMSDSISDFPYPNELSVIELFTKLGIH